jgi:hypothetical protein
VKPITKMISIQAIKTLPWIRRNRLLSRLRIITAGTLVLAAAGIIFALNPGSITPGTNVKVTIDNNNIEGGAPTPGFDSKNLEQQETSVAISPVDPNIVAVGSNDQRMAIVGPALFWVGLNVSADGGATWHNTFPPGFRTDTTPEGMASPLKGYAEASDPVVRFDGNGNLYYMAIAFNSAVNDGATPDNALFVTKYRYTPGTLGQPSTPNSAGNPPDFTYAFTTIIDRGSVTSLPLQSPVGMSGQFDDKDWMAVDTTPGSPGYGNIYCAFGKFIGLRGNPQIVFCRSRDGGNTFSSPQPVSQKGPNNAQEAFDAGISVAPNGRVYVSYATFNAVPNFTQTIQVVRSDDQGQHFGKTVPAATYQRLDPSGSDLAFRIPFLSMMAADDLNSNRVYLTFASVIGNPANSDVFVTRSTDGGVTWDVPVRVNDDSTSKHQIMPTIAVSHGAVHVAWYDLRNSQSPFDPNSGNNVMNVYYAVTNAAGVAYPAFSPNVRVSDVGHQPNCRQPNIGGVEAFEGDYIELAARFDGARHIVHIAWADNRDIPPDKCDLDSAPGPFEDEATGQGNQNIYADKLYISP